MKQAKFGLAISTPRICDFGSTSSWLDIFNHGNGHSGGQPFICAWTWRTPVLAFRLWTDQARAPPGRARPAERLQL